MIIPVQFDETDEHIKTSFEEESQTFAPDMQDVVFLHGNGNNVGANGATFIPFVSPEGVISWTNDKDLPNPDPVNIKGANGKDGYTPVKGTDYFTEADKAEIVQQVIAGLPKYNGEVIEL